MLVSDFVNLGIWLGGERVYLPCGTRQPLWIMMISKIKSFKLLPRETTSSSVAVQCEAKLIWQSHLGNAIVSNALQLSTRWFGHQVQLCNTFCKPPKTSLQHINSEMIPRVMNIAQCVLYECGILAAQEQNKRFHLKRKEGQIVCNVHFLLLFYSCLVLIFFPL